MPTKRENISKISSTLEAIRVKYRMSQREFATQLGVNHATYHRYETGSEPPITFLKAFIDAFPLEKELLMGIIIGDEEGITIKSVANNALRNTPPPVAKSQQDESKTERLSITLIQPFPGDTQAGFVYIKYLDVAGEIDIAAEFLPIKDVFGFVSLSMQIVNRRLHTPLRNLMALKITGNTMSPELEEGDTVVFDRARTKAGLHKEIFVVQVDDEVLCQYLQKTSSGALKLSSANERFEALELAADRVKVLGQVVWNDRTRV